jgi:hypothetical protein
MNLAQKLIIQQKKKNLTRACSSKNFCSSKGKFSARAKNFARAEFFFARAKNFFFQFSY